MIDKIYKRMAGENIVVEGEKGWFVSLNTRCICEVDFAERKGRILKYLGYTEESLLRYWGVVKCGDRLYLYPAAESKILILDLDGNQIKAINIEALNSSEKVPKMGNLKFRYAFTYEEYVFFLGYEYPAIVRLNTETDELTYITDWVETVEKKIENNNFCGYFSEGYAVREEKLYLPLRCIPGILELNANTLQSRIIDIKTTAGGIAGITRIDNETCCLSCCKDNVDQILLWNMKNNVVEKEISFTLHYVTTEPLHAVNHIGDKLYLSMLSPALVEFYEYDLVTGELKVNEILNNIGFGDAAEYLEHYATMCCFSEGNKILHFVSGKYLKWHEYNAEMEELDSYDIYFEGTDEMYNRIFTDTLKEQALLNVPVKETLVPLEGLINCILSN